MRLQTLPSRGVAPRIAARNASKTTIARRATTLAAKNDFSSGAKHSLNPHKVPMRSIPCNDAPPLISHPPLAHLHLAPSLPAASESLNMLEAFFIGRALAEVVNERLGSLVGDTLAEVGRLDAELRRTVQDIQDEVMARAQREMAAAAGGDSISMSGGASGSGRALIAAPADLGESVDNLRAEVAAARALVQQVKLKPAVLK